MSIGALAGGGSSSLWAKTTGDSASQLARVGVDGRERASDCSDKGVGVGGMLSSPEIRYA